MIFETIVSTINNKGQVNFAPFGIRKRKEFIFISPYIPSKTLENLKQTKCASINYLDDSCKKTTRLNKDSTDHLCILINY